STKILRAMNRKGNAKRYLRLVEKLRKAIPDIAIRSTFMVGFPGEDDDDFAVLLDFIKEAQLDRVGVFMYSPEEGTKASVMSGMVKKATQDKRYNRLMQLQQTISLQRLEKTIGNVVEVLVEEKVDANNYIGRTQYDAPDIDGIFFLTADGINVNDIVLAKITDTLEYDRIGVLI
ncbi:MAG TPA: radical SAM protein, partial [Spirochaetota bacterium]|nr:radical SAM protein [Spirochaetota bacterium]